MPQSFSYIYCVWVLTSEMKMHLSTDVFCVGISSANRNGLDASDIINLQNCIQFSIKYLIEMNWWSRLHKPSNKGGGCERSAFPGTVTRLDQWGGLAAGKSPASKMGQLPCQTMAVEDAKKLSSAVMTQLKLDGSQRENDHRFHNCSIALQEQRKKISLGLNCEFRFEGCRMEVYKVLFD